MKLKSKLCAAALLVLSGVGTASAGYVLHVPQYYQEHSNWCWSAAATMILNAYGKAVAQCTFVNASFNINYACGNGEFYWNSPANQGNHNWNVDDAMNYFWGNQSFYYASGHLSMGSVQWYINNGKPFVLSWVWTAGGAHDVVLIGYHDNLVAINDPWNGSYWRTYDSTVSASDRYWRDVVLTK